MKIKSAEFIKGVVGDDDILSNDLPQIAFIGRSNVGKSSVINALAGKEIARSSATPGKTREINFFLINKDFYLADLPGYGFAKASLEERNEIRKLIFWYLLFANVEQKKIIMIIDAFVGLTEDDLHILRRLNEREKNLIVVANKVDKIKQSEYHKKINKIKEQIGSNQLILCSVKEKTGLKELMAEIEKAVV